MGSWIARQRTETTTDSTPKIRVHSGNLELATQPAPSRDLYCIRILSQNLDLRFHAAADFTASIK